MIRVWSDAGMTALLRSYPGISRSNRRVIMAKRICNRCNRHVACVRTGSATYCGRYEQHIHTNQRQQRRRSSNTAPMVDGSPFTHRDARRFLHRPRRNGHTDSARTVGVRRPGGDRRELVKTRGQIALGRGQKTEAAPHNFPKSSPGRMSVPGTISFFRG